MTTKIATSVSLTPRPGQFPAVIRFRPTGGEDETPPGGGENPPPADPPNDELPGTTPAEDNEFIKFSPDKLKERLKREADTTEKALWKQLGVTNADDAKAKLKKLDELEDAQRTETERLQKQLTDAQKLADDYKDIAQREVDTRRRIERNNVINEAATAAGANPLYVDVLVPLIEKVIATHFEGVEDISANDLKSHVEKLRTDKPALFEAVKTPADTNSGDGNPPPKPNDKKPADTVKGLPKEEYNKRLREMGLK